PVGGRRRRMSKHLANAERLRALSPVERAGGASQARRRRRRLGSECLVSWPIRSTLPSSRRTASNAARIKGDRVLLRGGWPIARPLRLHDGLRDSVTGRLHVDVLSREGTGGADA